MAGFDACAKVALEKFSPGDLYTSKWNLLTWEKTHNEYELVSAGVVLKDCLFVLVDIIFSGERTFIEAIKFDGGSFFVCETDFSYFCEKVK